MGQAKDQTAMTDKKPVELQEELLKLQYVLKSKITGILNLIQWSGQNINYGEIDGEPEFLSLCPTLYFTSSRDDLYGLIRKSRYVKDKKGMIEILNKTMSQYKNSYHAIEEQDYAVAFEALCEAYFHVGLLWAKYHSGEGEPITTKAAGAMGISAKRERSFHLIETCRKVLQKHEYNGKYSAPQLSGFLAKKIVSDENLAQSLRADGYSTNEEVLAKKLQGLLYTNNDGKAFFEELKSRRSKP